MRLYLKESNETFYKKNFKLEKVTWILSNNLLYNQDNVKIRAKYFSPWKEKNNFFSKKELFRSFDYLPINFSKNHKLFNLTYSSYNSLPIKRYRYFNNKLNVSIFKLIFFARFLNFDLSNKYMFLLNFITYWSYSPRLTNNFFLNKKKLFKRNHLTFNIKSI